MSTPRPKSTGRAPRGKTKLVYSPLSKLRPRDGNPKKHDLGRLKTSIEQFGFVAPVVIEKDGTIVAGHGRVRALVDLRMEGAEVPQGIQATEKDWLVPCIVGSVFESKTRGDAYAIADNRLVELGGWDNEKLDGVLERIQKECGGKALEIIGWSSDKLISEIKAEGSSVRVARDSAGRIILVYLDQDERAFWLKKLGICRGEKIETLRRAQWRRLQKDGKEKHGKGVKAQS